MMRRLALLVFMATSLAGAARAGDFEDDLRERRIRFMERLGPDSMLILWSAPVKVYSNDVDYEFRQDSSFYYLTGIDQSESILVLMPGNRDRKEILFVKPRDPVREHWNGHLFTGDEAIAERGSATVSVRSEVQPVLYAS